MFLTPYSVVAGQKFSFKQDDNVVCFITGSMLSTSKRQDYCSYLDDYIYRAMRKTADIAKLLINYDTAQMSSTIKILETMIQHHISIHQSKFKPSTALFEIRTPGYEELIDFKNDLY